MPVRSTDAHRNRSGPDFKRRGQPEEDLWRQIRNRDNPPPFRDGADVDSDHLAVGRLELRRGRAYRSAGTHGLQSPPPAAGQERPIRGKSVRT